MIYTNGVERMKETDPYLVEFQRFDKPGAGGEPSWVYPIRKAGMARFAELGFPTLHDEDWRFTNVAPIAKLPFTPLLDPSEHGLKRDHLESFHFVDIPASRLVFVDGHFSSDLSQMLSANKRAYVGSLAAAIADDHPVLEKHLGQHART